MHINDLQRASELEKELKLWLDAEMRAEPHVFKQARLMVADMAHGYAPVPGTPAQNTEVVIQLTPEIVLPFIKQQIQRVKDTLIKMGVDL